MIDLEPLAKQLGVAVEKLMDVFVYQAPINGIIYLIFYAIVLASVYGTYRLALWSHKKVTVDHWDDVTYIWPSVAASFCLVMVIFSVLSVPRTVAAFYNPEYWAIKEILRSVRGI